MAGRVVELQPTGGLEQQRVEFLHRNLVPELLVLGAYRLVIGRQDAVHATQHHKGQDHVAYLALLERVTQHNVSDVPHEPDIGAMNI